MSANPIDLSVYLVIGPQDCGSRSPLDIVGEAVQGGASVVQLRDKSGSTRQQIELAHALLNLTRPAGVPLIINDRLDVALAVDADGLHVGQEDMEAAQARALLGPKKLLGLSVSSQEQLDEAPMGMLDYLGIGACYATGSKDNAVALGLDGFAKLTEQSTLPVVGIGGISIERARDVIAKGGQGVAVISAICAAPSPLQATRAMAEKVRKL
ncbi:thiamine phosphate synthase [Polycladidibacter hongkongensis]|uniref:thiamine phosphate synthase n=1 Tax=Polycladidibacter hongkongensis TaxID=1647556 RepID=UPI000AC672DD|nr:thiamine phosphate synthase [Pseudovibrio hongkongensis]